MSGTVSGSDWIKGIGFSLLASIIGGASKLSIRKSWLIEEKLRGPNSDFILLREPAGYTDTFSQQGEDEGPVQSTLESIDGAIAEVQSTTTAASPTDLSNAPFGSQGAEPKTLYFAYFLRTMGMLGMTIFNPLCSVVAMNYASPSILAPFSGLTMVWIILFSPVVVGETASRLQIIACSLILVGEVIVAAFGDHTNDEGITVSDVTGSYFETPFLLFVLALIAWMAILARWMLDAGTSPLLTRFSWGVAGGSVTGLQNFLKDALTVLKATNDTDSHVLLGLPVPPLIFFALFLGAIASAFGGLVLLTLCMKRYDATYSASMFVGSFVVSASIMSAIHYDTFANLNSLAQGVLYPTGLILLLVGVYLLAVTPYDEGAVLTVNNDRVNDSLGGGQQSVESIGRDEQEASTNEDRPTELER